MKGTCKRAVQMLLLSLNPTVTFREVEALEDASDDSTCNGSESSDAEGEYTGHVIDSCA